MELSKSYDHPSLLLVNEIEILFTQIRLMELYVKQAQATAGKDAARIREQFQAELTALQSEVKQKDLSLETQRARSEQRDKSLREQAENLRNQLLASQHLLTARQTELDLAQSHAAVLSARLAELESNVHKAQLTTAVEVARNREALEVELTALRAKLDGKQSALENLEASVKTAEEQLRAQIRNLHDQLAAKAEPLEHRTAELRSAQSKTVAERQRSEALELPVAQAQENAYATTGIRETLQRELLALQTALEQKDLSLQQHHAASKELQDRLNGQLGDLRNQLTEKQGLLEARNQEISQLAAKTNNLQSQLAEKQGLVEKHRREIGELTAGASDLQQQITCLELTNKQTIKEARAASKALEDYLNARIRELEAIVAEKSQRLHQHTAELETAQSETGTLRQRIQQLEIIGAQMEADKNDAERMRAALQSELNNAHRALEQRDTVFAQRETEFKDSSERLNAQLQILRPQLAETQQLLDAKEEALGHALTRIAGLEERVTGLDSAVATEVEQVRQQSQSELEALQAELRDTQQAVQHHQAAVAESEGNFKEQIRDLQNQLAERKALWERRDQEFEQLGLEAGLLRNRIAELEFSAHEAERSTGTEAERIRGEFQVELALVQAQLKEKEHALGENQAFIRESETRWQSQTRDLQIQLTEKQLLCEARSVEILGLQERLSVISGQLATLESANQQAAADAARNAALERQQFEAELGLRQEEFKNMERLLADREAQSYALQHSFNVQLNDLQNQLVEKQGLIEEYRQEVGQLTTKTNDLQGQLAEKQGLFEARSQEIHHLTAKTDDLQGQLDKSHGLLEARNQEFYRLTAKATALQEEITRLQQANSQRVEETQAKARALEDSLNTRLRELETTVSEKSQRLHQLTAELETAQSETGTLRQRIQQLEIIGAQMEADKNDAERMRATLQSELNNAHRALEQRDTVFAQRETEFKESSERLNAQLQILRPQLAEERGAIEDQKRELGSARSAITALRNRIEELESSKEAAEKTAHVEIERLREDYQLELAGLRADVDKQQLVLEERQSTIQALEIDLKDERQRLEVRIAEQRSLADRSDAECRANRLEIAALREEMARSEFARRQTEMFAAAQAEQLREQVKSEVGALDAQLMAKEATLKALTDQARELESAFSVKIEDLQRELSEKQSLLESRNSEMSELRSQITDLLEQIVHLERANRDGLEEHRIAATDLEQSLRLQLNELQNQLADKQAVLAVRNDEIRRLESQASQAELAVTQAEGKAADAMELMRRQSESQLESLQAEMNWKLEDLQRREAVIYSTESNLHGEIDALRAEVAEKRSLLENRNDELLRVKAETDGLKDRVLYLEAAAAEAQVEATNKSGTVAQQDRIELEKLWNELGQTEQMLEQRQAAVNDSEADIHAQINGFRNELADRQALLENPSKGLLGEPTLSETQKEKLNRLEQLVETIKADNEQTLSPHNRRWRFSLGRKRRWKS